MHLISVGNERILLSIYLTKNLCIAFETSKPNAKIRNQLQTEIEEHDLIAKDISPPHDHESTLKTAYKHTKAKLLSFSQRMHSPQKDSG
uniref:Uncharacterized protein n=1 Tax=Megaselia scalaris TaxID=36166 RepID=T1GAK0_MEGSC